MEIRDFTAIYIYNKVAKYVVSGYFGDPAGTKPESFGK